MPRQTERPTTRRTQLADTGGLPSIRPAAAPTDPYMSVPEGNSLQRSLQNAVRFLEEKGRFDGAVAKQDFEEGMLAQYKETDPNLDEKSKAFINGYNRIEGKLLLGAYKTAVATALEKHGELPWDDPIDQVDPETGEPVQGFGSILVGIEKDFMNKLPENREALKAFAPEALEAKQLIKKTYELQQVEAEYQNLVAKNAALINMGAEEILNGEPEDIGLAFRAAVSEHQNNAAALGMSRDEIAGLWVKQLGQMAVEEGRPELLDFIDVPAAEGGIRILDTKHAAKAIAYRQQARNAAKSLNSAKAAEEKEALKSHVQGLENRWIAEASGLDALQGYKTNSGKVVTAAQAAAIRRSELLTGIDPVTGQPFSELLSPTNFKYVVSQFDDHIQGIGAGDRTDTEVYRALRYNAMLVGNGEFTSEDWQKMYLANKDRLSTADRKALTNVLADYAKVEQSEFKTRLNHAVSTEEEFLDNAVFGDEAVKKMGVLSPDLNLIHRRMVRMYQNTILDAEANGNLDLKTVRELGKAAYDAYKDQLETVLTRIRDKHNERERIVETSSDPEEIR